MYNNKYYIQIVYSQPKKTTALLGGCFRCWHLPIFPGRHHPSIFGTIELNFRVRHGNGWTLDVINTNFFCIVPDDFVIILHCSANCKSFFNFFQIIFIQLVLMHSYFTNCIFIPYTCLYFVFCKYCSAIFSASSILLS